METRREQRRRATEARSGDTGGLPGVSSKGAGSVEVRGLATETGVLKAGLEGQPAQQPECARHSRRRQKGLRRTLADMPGEITGEHVAQAIWMPAAILLLVLAPLFA